MIHQAWTGTLLTSYKIRAKRGYPPPMASYSYQILIPMKIRVVVFSWMLASSGLQTTAQTRVDLKTQSKSVDFSGASTTKPLKAGNSLPATCSVGELFFLTSGSAGTSVYVCSATNAWMVPGTASVFGRTGAVTAQSGDYTFSLIGGTAVKSQLPSIAMYTDSPPASPGFASAATNWLGFDSTANKWHIWDGQDGTLPVLHPGDAILIQGGVRAQPTTPPSGQAALYVNSTDKKIHSVDDTGLDTAYGAGGGGGGSGVTRIDYQGAASAITGDATDHTIYTTTVNSIPAGGCVNVKFGLTHSTGSASVTYKLFYSTFVVTWAALAHSGVKAGEALLCNNAGVQNAQQWNVMAGASNNGGSFAGTLPGVATGGAINSVSSQILKLTFNVASTDQVTPQFWYVTESN